MTFLTVLKETLESGDPTIRSWFMIESYYPPFLCCLMYVIFVKRLGPALMENRKPFDLRKLMIVYNLFIVISYVTSVLLLAYLFLTTNAYTMICAPTVVYLDDWTYVATSTGWVIYMLKYIEFADTVFFVLRKKDHLVTNLHVIHHASLPIAGWIALRTEKSGFQFIPGAINCFVHIIMYTYYGLAAMGPEVQKYLWWKEHLTKLQMFQFILILFFVLVLIPLSGCKTTTHGIYMDIVFAVLFLGLFYNFYTKTYKKTPTIFKKKESANGKAVNGKASNGSAINGEAVDGSVVNGGSSSKMDSDDDKECTLDAIANDFPVQGPIKRR